MKTLIFLIVSLALISSTAQAQNTVLNKTQKKSGIQKQDRIHQEDHLYYMDGKLYQMKQGMRNEVKSQVKLGNGTVVNPDGSYVLKTQDRLRMANGECMDMSGHLYKNQNMFNQRRMMDDNEMRKQRNPGRATGKGTPGTPQRGTPGTPQRGTRRPSRP